MVFRAPRAQQEPHAAEIVREHLDGRFTAQVFKLVPGDHSHPHEKRFQQLNEDIAIGEHAPMNVGIYRIVDHVRLLLDMLAACLAEKMPQQSGNAKMSPIGGEAVSGNLHGASTDGADLLAGGTGADAVLCFGQADDTTGTDDTYTFLKERRPGSGGHAATEKTSIDQIKSVIGKRKRLECVHHAEPGIVQPLHPCPSACVLDHRSTEVDADHLGLGIFEGHIKRPIAGAAGDIEDVLHLRDIERIRKQTAHPSGDKAMLVHQACRFCSVFDVNDIGVFAL